MAKSLLFDAFSRIGLELIDVKFEGIDTTPEWRDRLFYIRTGSQHPNFQGWKLFRDLAKAFPKAREQPSAPE